MNYAAAATLLSVIAQYDPTAEPATPEDISRKAQAWSQAIRDDLPFPWAREAVVRHYASTDESITPSRLNALWRAHVERAARREEVQVESHCGRPGCDCSHSSGCFKGWLGSSAGVAVPCGRCRPWTARRVQDAPPPGKRTEADLYRLRGADIGDRADLDLSPVARSAGQYGGAVDDSPVERDPAKIAERFALIRRLAATPDLTEDQREQAMVDLIAAQR